MTPKFKSILVISAIILMILFIGSKWWSDAQNDKMCDVISKLTGQNTILLKQDSILQLLIKSQQASIDSSKQVTARTTRDTLIIYRSYSVNVGKVKALSTDSSISFLANRLI